MGKRKRVCTSEDDAIIVIDEEAGGKAENPPRPPREKRKAYFQKSAPTGFAERMKRALSQRLYLIESTIEGAHHRVYHVLGSTGNVYSVNIRDRPSCSCPDFEENRNICKHLGFVFVKVLRQSVESELLYQRALLKTELEKIFAMGDSRSRNPRDAAKILAKDEVIRAFRAATSPNGTEIIVIDESDKDEEHAQLGGAVSTSSSSSSTDIVTTHLEAGGTSKKNKNKRSKEDEECGVCFDRINFSQKKLYDDCSTCKKALHAECLSKWLERATTCPYCRSQWKTLNKARKGGRKKQGGDTHASPAVFEDEGYLNLGRLQGQSSARPATTSRRYEEQWWW